MVRSFEVQGDKVKVEGEILPGRILSAILRIEDGAAGTDKVIDPGQIPQAEWERLFDEMCALSPVNEFPADISREAMYLSDEELGISSE